MTLALLLMLSLVALPVTAYANMQISEVEPAYEDIMPLWDNISRIDTHITINNGRAEISGFVFAFTGTTSITVNVVLERINANGTRTQEASWNNLHTNGNLWAWEATRTVARGHEYHLTFTVTAVRNGVSETVTAVRTVWAE